MTLPAPSLLYDALLRRDPVYEGRALVGVRSTGIYCRLTCPARKPRPENCDWFADAAAASAAGYRACKRCYPGAPAVMADPLIRTLTQALDADPCRRWSEADLAAMGHDPSTVRRAFHRHFGQSFLSLARDLRLRAGMRTLQKGSPMIDAQLDAGFSSASGFRQAFRRLFGHAPHQMTGATDLRADWIDTDLGAMIVIADDTALHLLEFTERKALVQGLARLSAIMGGRIGLGRTAVTDRTETALSHYLAGHAPLSNLPVRLHGTAFQIRVWQELQRIPAGRTISYAQLATAIGRPSAVRAVAGANAANRLALVVPCHRVIAADGGLGGYAGGLDRKERLIAVERAYA